MSRGFIFCIHTMPGCASIDEGLLGSWHGGEQGVLEFRRAKQKGGGGRWKHAK